MYNFLDTSAILNGALNDYSDSYISMIALNELENIKTSANKDEETKFKARKAVRIILESNNISYGIVDQKKVNKILKKYNFLSDINDHRLLCEAILLNATHNIEVNFITSDICLYLFARHFKELNPIFYSNKTNENNYDDSYNGWSKYYPTEEHFALLYSNPEMNILNAKTNEFAEIYEDSNLRDVLFWTGKNYRPLKYKEMKNPYLNETLKPRNLEQKMAFDLLQNPIGYLPGDLNAKMSIWGGPLADHLGGQEMLDQLIDDKVIEIFPLSHIRGRSIRNSIVICDECENMNDKLVTLLMSRIEDGSELIFCGDVAQIDNKKFEKNNGIRSMITNLAGEPLFGTVKLLKSERGPVASMCDKMRPPI